ncbi:uncharacterized protein A1O9_13111 [Exophiala aquamarina CBS 119918]|uniref:Glycosyltransferase family 31 protein n=1 Tax=Exophiala aquamarina CBS 119918 TaxID=1182545 RepID=A0A072NSL4_9EURO|nr:uncharacterized protein A1O9_13111 [Exophiala aquamarina CBS 119918]KEF50834.1 hypothetical protein A1O9_13111 [Exophiala aquamarina CBS 119918]
MVLRPAPRYILFTIVLVVCVLVSCHSFGRHYSPGPLSTPSSVGRPAHVHPVELVHDHEYRDTCTFTDSEEDFLIVVKTGANEIHDKLPTQLLTGLRCYHDILIFSDLEENIGPFNVHDALKNVSSAIQARSPEFEYYRQLRDYRENNLDISSLRGKSHSAAWKLDKFKFIPMLEETWKMRPHRKWYIFIEADTYLVRTNLLLWLARQDPSQLIYFGSPTYFHGEEFAHGGSGVVLSGAALSRFVEGDGGSTARYDDLLQSETFGDYILMKALRVNGVTLSSRWPMLQGEKPSTIPFGPGPDNGVRHWCQPILTMHHITPEEACAFWDFEQKRNSPSVRHHLPESTWAV